SLRASLAEHKEHVRIADIISHVDHALKLIRLHESAQTLALVGDDGRKNFNGQLARVTAQPMRAYDAPDHRDADLFSGLVIRSTAPMYPSSDPLPLHPQTWNKRGEFGLDLI